MGYSETEGEGFDIHIVESWMECFIDQVWRERNNKLFKQMEEKNEQIMEKIKEVYRHRTAKLRNVATDPVNMALHQSWGLFESIFDNT